MPKQSHYNQTPASITEAHKLEGLYMQRAFLDKLVQNNKLDAHYNLYFHELVKRYVHPIYYFVQVYLRMLFACTNLVQNNKLDAHIASQVRENINYNEIVWASK
jgi:hypothetical protein